MGALGHRLADQAAAADQAERLAPDEGAHQVRRLAAGKFSGARHAVAFDHPPRHREHQAESEVGGGFGGDRRGDGDRNAPRRRRLDVDIGRRDRLRRDQAQIRIGHDHVAVDLVVQQAEQNVRLAHRADQRALGDDAARIGKQRHPRHRAQTLERLLGHRLGHENARTGGIFGHQASHRTTPATPSTATCAPSGMRRVASSTPSTIGMPRSRASEARCEVEPPSSATTPPTRGKMWLKAGPATRVTRISPGRDAA